MAETKDPKRFERIPLTEIIGSCKIRNRRFSISAPLRSTGDFLSRIWALYGPPDVLQFEGFTYVFRDTETGLHFSAYSAGSGPAFGGFRPDHERLLPVVDSFESLIDSTKPADCEIQYETDFGWYSSGARNGQPFDRETKRPTFLEGEE